MTITDYAIMLAFVFTFSWVALKLKERIWPEPAEALGYIPDSESPPWGWPVAWGLGIAAAGLLLFGPMVAARLVL